MTRGTPSYDDIQEITQPNDLIAAAILIESDIANQEISESVGSAALAALEERAISLYDQNAGEFAYYEALAADDTKESESLFQKWFGIFS